jgi:hypothetical protein
MDILAILAELHGQRDRINQAIEALESLDGTSLLGNGPHLPIPVTKPAATVTLTAGRRSMSPAARKKIALAQKARWAAQKKSVPVAASKSAPIQDTAKSARKTAPRVVSPESRKKMVEAQQKRWAKKRAGNSAAKKASAAPVVKAAVKEAAKA